MRKTMEQEEKPEQAPPLPVLPRLDRLDRLLQLLEEKHSNSGRHSSNPLLKKTEQEAKEEEDHRKSLTSALDEVHHKGTLIDRLALLENRVLQLSLEMDEGNTSRSSSSTVQVSKTPGHDMIVSKGSTHDDDQLTVTHHTEKEQPPVSIQERPSEEDCITTTLTEESGSGSGSGKGARRKGYSKWLGWFRCGRERQWDDDFGHNRVD